MSTNYNSGIVTDGLVLYCDTGNTRKSWKGKPTTNIVPDMSLIGMGQGLTVTYVGLENGWKKYSISGTWTGGGYPYSMNVDGVTFAAGTYYSTSCYIKTNVPSKFANVFTGMNYVNQPMNDSGTSFSVTQSDGSIFVGRSGFAYTSATSQVGYLVSNPNVGQVFTAATDFVYIKSGQIELGTFPTPFVAGTRSTTQAILDLTNNNTLTATSLTYSSDGTFSFNGSSDVITIPGSGVLNISSAITASAWVYYVSGNGRFLQKDGPPYTRCWEMGGYAGTFRTELWHSDGTTLGAPTGNALAVNGWTHCVMTFDGINQVMYQNGVAITTTSFPGNIRTDVNTPVFIGGYWGGEYFNGKVGNVQIYNRALSADEIKQNFNALRGRYGL